MWPTISMMSLSGVGHESEHDCMLNEVVQLLQSAGLKLNTPKCQFSKTSPRFLGYTVSAQGVHPNEDHLNAMLHAPVPTDAHQLRSFLGLISWYSKFIPNFATVVEPFHACIRKGVDFSWAEEAQKSFNTERVAA